MNTQHYDQYNQYQPIQQINYEYPKEEVVQGKPISVYQVQLDQNNGQYQQQPISFDQIQQLQQPLLQQQQFVQPNQSEYPQFDDSLIKNKSQQQSKNQQNTKKSEDKSIIHNVLPNDTLIGLSIRYNVSEFAIKKFNNLDSDDICHKTTLRIPNPTTNLSSEQDDYDMDLIEKRKLIRIFQREVLKNNDKSEKLANYYLTEANWQYYEAEKQYLEDLQWEKENEKQMKKFKK